jgi:hypothetical protein
MKTIFACALLIASGAAFATHHSPPPKPEPPPVSSTAHAGASADANSESKSISGAAARADGGDASALAAGGASDASSTSSSGGNTLISNSNAVRNAPSVFAPSFWPTAACQSGVSLGAAGINGGGSLGFGFTKKECQTIVLAQNLQALGYYKAACEALMATPSAVRVWPNKNDRPLCTDPIPPSVLAPAAPPTVTDDTAALTALETRMNERIDRAFRKQVAK